MHQALYPYFHPSKVAGVSLTLLSESQYSISYCVLKKQKDTVIIEHKDSHVESLEALAVAADGLPVVMAIAGKGILLKKTAKADDEKALHLAMPGAKLKDFYLETWPAPVEEQWVGLARKHEIDALLDQCQQLKIQVCNLHFGPFKVAAVLPFINHPPLVQTGHYSIQWEQQQAVAVQKLNAEAHATYQIGEDRIAAGELLPYSLALGALMHKVLPESRWQRLAFQREEFYERRIYRKASVAGLAMLLFMLGVNTVLFSGAYAENEQLKAQTASYKSKLVQLQALQDDVSRKEQIIKSLGIENNNRPTFYLDRLGASLPVAIQLTELTAFPLEEEKFKKKQKLYFNAEIIRVSGLCQNPATLHQWLSTIEQFDWVLKIQGQQYHYDTRLESGVFEFLIMIK